MISFRRFFFSVFLSFGFLYGLVYLGLIDLRVIETSLISNSTIIVFAFLILLIMNVLIAFRYFLILRAFSVPSPINKVIAASLACAAISIWFPSSIVLNETFRVLFMFGASRGSNRHDNLILVSKIITVSVFDRLVGFFVILSLGAFFSFTSPFFLNTGEHLKEFRFSGLLAAIGAAGILISPYLAGAYPIVAPLKYITKVISVKTTLSRSPILLLLAKVNRLFVAFEAALSLFEKEGKRLGRFVLPALVSLVCIFLWNISTYLFMKASNIDIPLSIVFSVSPLVAIISLLPLGFAGIGGFQFFIGRVYSIFGIDPVVAASTNILQGGCMLLVTTILGLFVLFQNRSLIVRIVPASRNINDFWRRVTQINKYKVRAKRS